MINLFLCIQVCLKSTPLGGSLYLNLVVSQCHVWPHFSSTLFKYGWLNCVFQTLILILLCVFLFSLLQFCQLWWTGWVMERTRSGRTAKLSSFAAWSRPRPPWWDTCRHILYISVGVSLFIYCLKSFQKRACITNSSTNSILYCILLEDSVGSKLFSSMVVSLIW